MSASTENRTKSPTYKALHRVTVEENINFDDCLWWFRWIAKFELHSIEMWGVDGCIICARTNGYMLTHKHIYVYSVSIFLKQFGSPNDTFIRANTFLYCPTVPTWRFCDKKKKHENTIWYKIYSNKKVNWLWLYMSLIFDLYSWYFSVVYIYI